MKHIKTKVIIAVAGALAFIFILSTGLMILFENVTATIPNLAKPVFVGVALRQFLALLFVILITFLLATLLSKKAIQPIIKLREATKEVTRGNYNIEVPETARQDELGQLQRDFNQMVRALQSNEYLQKDFISSVSHEFKTPLASIQGYAKLLSQDHLAEQDRKNYTDIILEESGRLLNLSSNILHLSKLENQEIPELSSRFWLDEQIRGVILFLEPEWRKKKIMFDVELEPMQITGYKDNYWQIWINLISNAIKFSPKESTIRISSNNSEKDVCINITDQGPGISEEAQQNIFNRFYQADRSHKSEGNGLGLAIVKRILVLSGGSIGVKSTEGLGSTFIISLPKEV